MNEAELKSIEEMAIQERKVFPLPTKDYPLNQQVDTYIRETAKRAIGWPTEALDIYARKGEDLTRGVFRRLFTNELYLERIHMFRAVADEKYCNEFNLTLQERLER